MKETRWYDARAFGVSSDISMVNLLIVDGEPSLWTDVGGKTPKPITRREAAEALLALRRTAQQDPYRFGIYRHEGRHPAAR